MDKAQFQKAIDDRRLKIRNLILEVDSTRKEIGHLETAYTILFPEPIAEEIWDDVREIDLKEGVVFTTKYGELKEAVRESILNSPQEIVTVNDITPLVSGILPSFNVETGKANVSAYLKEFADEGSIELIEPGRGRLPATYKIKFKK